MRGAVLKDDRPTAAQWGTANGLCIELGMENGCEDDRFIAFTNKTCKVSHPRFLTRDAMSKLIAALNKWNANKNTKGTDK
jgi:hypothetical protein